MEQQEKTFWLCVDITGEKAFKHKPIRWKDNPRNLKEVEIWISQDDNEDNYLSLPSGTIETLLNYPLTWSDEPVEIGKNFFDPTSKTIREQYNTVYKNLFGTGGIFQARLIFSEILNETPLNPDEVLDIIKIKLKELTFQANCGLVKKDSSSLKDGKPYLCIDDNYKLCIRNVGGENWESVQMVFPYMSINHISDLFGENFGRLW